MAKQPALIPAAETKPGEYVVVARRYRPQTFEELIGQEHVARALANAISTGRVGHAYLFTGARGVGKTSAARILAKALDCIHGPTPTPCNECDICRSVSAGSDVDVLEIDGASNRGIDEIRQLRQNANVRPSRARFKIYIIDEVHMLTREAFNALLKTLEEPPEHVKFIFCTTEAEKIPITILSRCQRYDFAGIQTGSISARLKQIAAAEKVDADDDALGLIARRAAGSMRDSQSLLEQLFAFGKGRITAADVHEMLGTADEARVGQLVSHIVARDAAGALAELDAALAEGTDVGQLLEQLLGYLRDCMAAAVGVKPDLFLNVSPSQSSAAIEASQSLGLETILAVIQIFDQTLSRLRYSTHGRTLLEMALVRACKLEDLSSLSDLIQQLQSGEPAAPRPTQPRPAPVSPSAAKPPAAPAPVGSVADSKKKEPPAASSPSPNSRHAASLGNGSTSSPVATELNDQEGVTHAAPPLELTPENLPEIWNQVLASLSDLLAENASKSCGVAVVNPNRLAVTFPSKYNFNRSICERPDQAARLEQALAEFIGRPLRIEFRTAADAAPEVGATAEVKKPRTSRQALAEKTQHPLVRRAMELFDAQATRVDEGDVST